MVYADSQQPRLLLQGVQTESVSTEEKAMNNHKGIRPMRGKVQIRFQHEGRRYVELLPLAWSTSNIDEALRIRGERLARVRQGLSPIPNQPATPIAKPTTGWIRRPPA